MENKTLKYYLERLFTAVLCMLIATPSYAEQTEQEEHAWATKGIEGFEVYCYRSFGNYKQIDSMAKVTKLNSLPTEFVTAVMGPGSTDGKGYLLASDRPKGFAVILGLSRPDACSINVQGVPYKIAKEQIHSTYQLALSVKDDIGLQVSEVYVPGGKSGNKLEAADFGVIFITYPKDETGVKGYTIGYMPPNTVSKIYR